MKNKIRYSNEPIEFEVVKDFLPPPDKLVLKDENVRVTISLSKASIDFFKRIAERRHYPYQKMIRTVLDYYVSHCKSA